MLPAADVRMVEFVKDDKEVTQDPAEVKRVEHLLLSVQNEEKPDGSETASASPEQTD